MSDENKAALLPCDLLRRIGNDCPRSKLQTQNLQGVVSDNHPPSIRKNEELFLRHYRLATRTLSVEALASARDDYRPYHPL